jgi:hypothetical protein
LDWLGWIEALPHSVALRKSVTLYILVNAAHILGIGLLVGAILPLDLRLAGILRMGRIADLAPFLVRVAAAGLTTAILTGLLLFSVKPGEYAANPAFLAKIGLVALALANIVLQHRTEGWRRVRHGASPNLPVRVHAGLSLAIWLSALLAGRWIGFL